MIHLRASTDLTRWARGVGTWFNNIKNLINDTRSKSNNNSNLPTPSHQTRRVFAKTPFPGTPADLIPMTKRRTWLHYFFEQQLRHFYGLCQVRRESKWANKAQWKKKKKKPKVRQRKIDMGLPFFLTTTTAFRRLQTPSNVSSHWGPATARMSIIFTNISTL